MRFVSIYFPKCSYCAFFSHSLFAFFPWCGTNEVSSDLIREWMHADAVGSFNSVKKIYIKSAHNKVKEAFSSIAGSRFLKRGTDVEFLKCVLSTGSQVPSTSITSDSRQTKSGKHKLNA